MRELLEHIEYLERSYKGEIEKWTGIKKKKEEELKEAEDTILELRDKLKDLAEAQKKLGVE